MAREIQAPRIRSRESPRAIISADFKGIPELPIWGGWGYSMEDAVVIDKDDPVVFENVPFNGVHLEYVFVEQRIYEELIIFRDTDDAFSGIRWELLEQRSFSKDDRRYDVLTFVVTAIPDKDWNELKAEWEGSNGHGTPQFDIEAHNLKRDERTITYTTQYWFDITSFFGR